MILRHCGGGGGATDLSGKLIITGVLSASHHHHHRCFLSSDPDGEGPITELILFVACLKRFELSKIFDLTETTVKT